MPIRFSTQAANADFLRDDAETTGESEGMPHGVGADGRPRVPWRRPLKPEGEAKPGQDIDVAGFVKDRDPGKKS